MRPIVLQRLFVVAAGSWAASLFVSAYAAGRLHGETAYGFALAVYGIGSWICHQRPERSFHMWAAQLPGATVQVDQCVSRTGECDPFTVYVTTGLTGDFAVTYAARRIVPVVGFSGLHKIDCAAKAA